MITRANRPLLPSEDIDTTDGPNDRRVFIVNRGFHSGYLKARRHGVLVPITEGRVNIHRTDRMMASIQEALANSEPNDLLLLSGDLVTNTLASCYFLRKHGKVNLLYWDGSMKDYVKRDDMDFRDIVRTS